MRYRVDNGLRDDFNWNLVGNRSLDAAGSRADRPVNLGEHEVDRLVHQLEYSALVYLQRGYGFLYLGSVETETLDFRRQQETLGGLAE